MRVALLILLMIPAQSDAGHRRAGTRMSLRVARVHLRTARASSGRPVAWGFYYSARTAANVSGLFSPWSILGGLL